MRIFRTVLTSLALTSAVPMASAEVSFLLNVDKVNDSGGTPVSVTTGSWLIIADTLQNGFQLVEAGSVGANDFTSGDDMVVFRGDFTTFATDGVVSATGTGLSFANGWGAGDPLAFVWFPEGGSSSTVVDSGDAYGLYTSALGEDTSQPWITPADNTLDYSLQLLTTGGSGFFGPGTVDPRLADANLAVIPEPSISLLALASVFFLNRRRR